MSEEKKREKILDVKDLDITFETTAGKVHAIRGVNIDLYQGETVAIVGESGSGKSERSGKQGRDYLQIP